MSTYRRGDVVSVPVRFTNQTASKNRPVVVVSTDDYNQTTPDLLVMSITGQLTGLSHPGDYILQDWQSAGLRVPSKVQTKIVTIEASIITGNRGRLTDADMAGVQAGLREALDLPLAPTASIAVP